MFQLKIVERSSPRDTACEDETRTIWKEDMIGMARSTNVSVESGKGTVKFVAQDSILLTR